MPAPSQNSRIRAFEDGFPVLLPTKNADDEYHALLQRVNDEMLSMAMNMNRGMKFVPFTRHIWH